MEAEEQVFEAALLFDDAVVDALDDDGEQTRVLEAVVLVFDLTLHERKQPLVVVDPFLDHCV